MKKLFAIVVLATFYLLLSTDVAAQYGQPSPSLSITIDKTVGKPNLNKGGAADVEYVNTLGPSDPRFKPGQDIYFRLKIKNTSNVTLYGVVVKDFIPSYLTPIEGAGTYDSQNRTVSLNAGDFGADEEKTYYMKMRINSQDYLPADKGLFCLINKAQAYNNFTYNDDSSQFCIEKEVKPVTQVPSAGPEMGLALLALNMLGIGAGITFKKLSNNKLI